MCNDVEYFSSISFAKASPESTTWKTSKEFSLIHSPSFSNRFISLWEKLLAKTKEIKIIKTAPVTIPAVNINMFFII